MPSTSMSSVYPLIGGQDAVAAAIGGHPALAWTVTFDADIDALGAGRDAVSSLAGPEHAQLVAVSAIAQFHRPSDAGARRRPQARGRREKRRHLLGVLRLVHLDGGLERARSSRAAPAATPRRLSACRAGPCPRCRAAPPPARAPAGGTCGWSARRIRPGRSPRARASAGPSPRRGCARGRRAWRTSARIPAASSCLRQSPVSMRSPGPVGVRNSVTTPGDAANPL